MNFVIFGLLVASINTWLCCKGEYIPKWSCDFENGLCHWLQVHDDNYDWSHVSGSTLNMTDHTTNSTSGKFLLINGLRHDFRDEAKLMSPVLKANNGSCKMFFYHRTNRIPKHGNSLSTKVNLIKKSADGNFIRKSVFQSVNAHIPDWKKWEVILTSESDFQIEISAQAGFGREFVAIDDILFTEGCTTNEQSSVKIVKLDTSPAHNFPEGLFYQKSNGSWSMVCSSEEARSACLQLGLKDVLDETALNSGVLPSSKTIASNETLCLPANLTVPTGKTCSVSPGCLKVKHWRCSQDYLSMCPKLTHVGCTSSIDNLKCVSSTQICDFIRDCPGGEDESNCLNLKRCDFQKDSCDWVTEKSSIFNWKRHYGPSDIGSDSYFMKVTNLNAPSTNGKGSLRMIHQVQGQVNSSCYLRFFYQVVLNDGASLNVYIKENNKVQSIFRKTNSYWNLWRKAVVELPRNKTYHLFVEAYFEGRRGFGDIGFRNVSFTGSCHFTNFTPPPPNDTSNIFVCRTGEMIQKNVLCDFNHDCYDGEDESNCTNATGRCTFDASICDWQFGNGIKMLRRRYGTPSGGTGPLKDHTDKYSAGYYMYLEATDRRPGDYADLISRQFQQPKSKKCTFRWFYHMSSTQTYYMGKLNILYHDPESGIQSVLWSTQNDQGDQWKYGKVTFDVNSMHFKIIIRAIRGNGYRSDIAIDDVSFSSDCFDSKPYRPINIQQNCSLSGKFHSQNGTKGSVFSPGFPSTNYPDSVNCHWRITCDPKLRINITSHVFRTEPNDVVSIDAGTINATMIGGNFSGRKAPFFMVSSNNVADVWFTSDHSNHSDGFLISVATTLSQAQGYTRTGHGVNPAVTVIRDCSASSRQLPRIRQFYVSGRGTITPLRSGSSYLRRLDCDYKFVTSFGYRIKFLFADFKTESTHDYIQVYNSSIPGTTKFSGKKNPFSFVSYRENLWFLFHTDYIVEYDGFNLDFQATLEPASPARDVIATGAMRVSITCIAGYSYHNTYQTGSGTLTKGRYRNNENCLYQFTAPAGLRVMIAFLHFDLEHHYDYLRVLNHSVPGYQVFSGDHSPFYFISNTNSISLRFTTDGSITKTGFVLQFSVTVRAAKAATDDDTIATMPPPTTMTATTSWSHNTFLQQGCSYYGLTTGDSLYGAIKSPNYPNSYPSNLHCSWYTRYSYYRRKYVLHFQSFSTASFSDYVYIRDGPYSYSPLLQHITGRNMYPRPIVTTTSLFYIQFTSNSYGSDSGFLLRYSTYPGCFSCSSGFTNRIYTRDPLDCMKRCKSSGYAHAYIKAGSSCYCGHMSTYFSRYCTLKHPSLCNSCYWPYSSYKCGSYLYGSLYEVAAELSTPRPYSTTPYNPWPWPTTPYLGRQDETVGHPPSVGTIVGSLFGVSTFIAILSFFCYARYRKRRHPSTRITTGPNSGGANGTPSQQMPIAYFVPASTQSGAPPAYADAMNGRVYFFNNVSGTQTMMGPVPMTHEAPPSFVEATSGQSGEKPPVYESVSSEISPPTAIMVQGAQAAEPPRNVSPIPPKPDNGWQVSMPGVEEPTQVVRPPSRNPDYQSVTSLRGATNTGSAARLNAPPQRNPARSLPPIQRTRAVDNRAFDGDM